MAKSLIVTSSDRMSETADERTDVSGRTWYTTYTSLRLLFCTETIDALCYRSNKRISTLRTIR